MGLTLHPFDLATNKILAVAGRMEPIDFIDSFNAHKHIQHLGLLGCAACGPKGKDPGYSPLGLLDDAGRSTIYSLEELSMLKFDGPPPDFSAMLHEWKRIVKESRSLVEAMPVDKIGLCLVDKNGSLYKFESLEKLSDDLANDSIKTLSGSIKSAIPRIYAPTSDHPVNLPTESVLARPRRQKENGDIPMPL